MPTEESPASVTLCASALSITSRDCVCPLKLPVSSCWELTAGLMPGGGSVTLVPGWSQA